MKTNYKNTVEITLPIFEEVIKADNGSIEEEVIDVPYMIKEEEENTMKTLTYTTSNETTISQVNTSEVVKENVIKIGTPEDIAKVEMDVVDMTREELGLAIKHFTLEALRQMAVNAGITKLYDTSEPRIRKMRLIMGIKEAYFPTKTGKKQKIRPWRGVPLEECLERAKKYGITWKSDPCPKINRMRLVMALKKNNVPSPKDKMIQTSEMNAG